jgi:hypothetical protein
VRLCSLLVRGRLIIWFRQDWRQYFTTNSVGLTPVRTPGQVLYIAFGNTANATSGGFFPSRVNGNLNASTTAATSNTQDVSRAWVQHSCPASLVANKFFTTIPSFRNSAYEDGLRK